MLLASTATDSSGNDGAVNVQKRSSFRKEGSKQEVICNEDMMHG